jgi:hypothetical protein
MNLYYIMMMKYNDLPSLIDTTTGQFLYNSLKQCHDVRVTMYSYAFNAIVVFAFVSIGLFILYLCFTKKRTPEEEKAKIIMDQQIILEKIKSLKEQKQNYYQEGSMTNLPFTESDTTL